MLALLLALSACTTEPEKTAGRNEAPQKITNRIDIPAEVRNNLGITFVKAEKRQIASTLRVPGRFEAPPEATHAYSAMLEGRVELRVKQFAAVSAGEVLFTLDAPGWRDLQSEVNALQARMEAAKASIAAKESESAQAKLDLEAADARLKTVAELFEVIEKHSVLLRETEKVWTERLAALEELTKAGIARAAELTEARARLVDARAKFTEESEKHIELELRRTELNAEQKRLQAAGPRLEAELVAAQSEQRAANSALSLAVSRMAALSGLAEAELLAQVDDKPRWQRIGRLEVRSRSAGVVSDLNVASGAWTEQGAIVMAVQDPTKLRVRARALQADLTQLLEAREARILPPSGGALGQESTLPATLAFTPSADPDERVIELIATPQALARWARPGIAVEVEITLRSTAEPVTAIPLASVVRDELQRIFFRRDPNNPDKVIRIVGEFGASDGRWIEVKSAVMEGDEIVLQGVYELKLAGGGKPTGAGHFHADGTWHAGPDH